MSSGIIYSSGGLIVDNGTDFVIPGDPEPGQIERPKNPCKITVALKGVYYGGDNVGSVWKYMVSVNENVWISDSHTVQWRSWDVVGKKIYDEVRENTCEMTNIITIFIRAREKTGYLFDDIGERAEITAIPCEMDKPRRRLIIVVPVPEYPSLRWIRTILRKFSKMALLYFIFEIEAQCI